MSEIACLGWGSLIWDTRDLPIFGPWRADGPMVQVEFLRRSRDGRMTLVLDSSAQAAPSLWTLMSDHDAALARQALRRREGVSEARAAETGLWSTGACSPTLVHDPPTWARARDIDAVIWTALPPRFNNQERIAPTHEEVIAYLSNLRGQARETAERYIRPAPRQIDTSYRREIERELGWTRQE